MNNILINNIPYGLPEVKDMPIALVIELAEVHYSSTVKDQPEDKTDYQQLLTKIYPEVCGQIINAEEFVKAYAEYLFEEIAGALDSGIIDTDMTDEGVTLPPILKGYGGENIYLPEITAGDFCDATDLVALNPVKYSPVIISILCGNGRQNVKTHLERAISIKSKPFSLAISVINMLNAAHRYMKVTYPHCYGTDKTPGRESPVNTTWNDTLILAARAVPSEIEVLRQMTAYEFMNILNCKNKHRTDNA